MASLLRTRLRPRSLSLATAPAFASRPLSTTPTPRNGHPSNRDEAPRLPSLHTHLTGKHLLEEPMLNKGAAFTEEEREVFRLKHYLPCEVHPLDVQLRRAEAQLHTRKDPLAKYSFLRSMRDQNQILFYALVERHLKELLPIVYTPTVGEAIKEYSHIFRRPDGIFLSYPHFKEGGAQYLREALTDYGALNRGSIDLVVCTDSEGILGIGDQGIGGALICTGKQILYTLGAGVDPNRCLNVVLDPGTNNDTLLNDPLYMGWRHNRVRGKEYDDFVDAFVKEAATAFPDALIHFEDYGNANAYRLLEKFQPKYSVFNDDIQGTGAAALAALLSALKVTGTSLADARIVLAGAGTAGLGITNRIRDAMMQTEGLSRKEANDRFFLVDRYGLIHEGQGEDKVRPGQREFARSEEDVEGWTASGAGGASEGEKQYTLLDTVKAVRPTVLIGTSTIGRSFTQNILEEMAKHVDRPIILPISNPTSLCEVDPRDATQWTEGRALIATGSPFPAVKHPKTGKEMKIAELNNALIFPALGLGTILSKSTSLSDSMIVAGVQALASLSPAAAGPTESEPHPPLLPDLKDVRSVSVHVAAAVMRAAKEEGLAKRLDWPGADGEKGQEDALEDWIEKRMWKSVYRPLEPIQTAV